MKTTFYYLDTSALVKRYIQETGSDNMDYIFSLPFHKRIFSSIFTIVEFTSTGNRLLKTQRIDPGEWNEMTQTFLYDMETFIHFISVDDRIILLSVALVKEHGLRPGDAIQLASLIHCRDNIREIDTDIQFIASDNLLCLAAEKEGFKVHNPSSITEEWDIH